MDLIYKMKDNEWALFLKCYEINFKRLSPIAKANVKNLILAIQADKTIQTKEQLDVLFSFMSSAKINEKLDQLSKNKTKNKKETKTPFLPINNEILILIENIRLVSQNLETGIKLSENTKQKNHS